jgi:tubulin-specific chaperone A
MADQIDQKRVREIKIKSGVVKRLAKEKVSYEKEAEKMQEKLEKMKADDPEDYAIRKQTELLEESRSMVPDCQRRLVAAYDELLKYMDNEKDLRDTAEYQAAQVILDEAKIAAHR